MADPLKEKKGECVWRTEGSALVGSLELLGEDW